MFFKESKRRYETHSREKISIKFLHDPMLLQFSSFFLYKVWSRIKLRDIEASNKKKENKWNKSIITKNNGKSCCIDFIHIFLTKIRDGMSNTRTISMILFKCSHSSDKRLILWWYEKKGENWILLLDILPERTFIDVHF